LSKDVREGKRLEPGTMGDRVTIARAGEIDIDPDDMPQVITGTHKRRWAVTSAVRNVLGNEGWLPNPGEPIICKKNSQDHNLINGMMCQTVDCKGEKSLCKLNVMNDADQWLEVDCSTMLFAEHVERSRWKGKNAPPKWEVFDFAHAITCHSAQGSQWDHVLVYDEGWVFKEEARRWSYTACTRAAERLSVVLT
ncbi:MAG: ATP-binding domain-containing protein, partial [Geminicoccaceae bacterium]